ncbi:neurofilament heavy polypeptide-like [Olea europaea var. sylvestris]|uniref:neurofilament heavy polypeptide-like n=1 Tax=Olea europaea var. sylvestris TaxID=158386 RepID=UPI000C1CFC43|nr:neurofilament heavy polypeptide-like [Olea europaea var. sylvestris]XP_022892680.1 neurofilament heavy polypeptide-like [Olea europaea var. sylvestris]XP_022892681.1 neurofilament heavy polypeptide-like [Olea europaea var. sylvestris]XP_022892682.1 neurofilament heavy polypeptide-like [Olea europaea var. sylvestris]XP_022892683.1 neurofilament heavy polypeptide-like [Olea europaea var. sylvestris]
MEEELAAAGNRLLQPPESVDDLLSLLDQTEDNLSKVEQSPGKSMQAALSPLMKALVADELLKHSDIDVKVAVASCINEITRITAPDAPYDDERMKDIFQLIVSSFEHLSDKSSRSYAKRAMILETVSKVRSCVIMLDLECDQMIIEMFQHFLKTIRDYHPENIFSSMETIMILVIEESEDISPELLTVLLASVKRNSEELLPVAMKLGERVFEKCGVKLKPYLTRTVKSLGISLDDYSEVVASICKDADGPVGHSSDSTHGDQLVIEKKSASDPSDQVLVTQVTERNSASDSPDRALATQVTERNTARDSPERVLATQLAKDVTEETSSEKQNPNVKSSPKAIVSNGVCEPGNGGIMTNADFKKEEALDDGLTSKTESDDLAAEKLISSEPKPDQASKERGREPNTSNNSIETSDIVNGEKEMKQVPDQRESEDKEFHAPPGGATLETAKSLDKVKETENDLPPSNASEREVLNVASPSPTGKLLDESHPKKGGRKKRKENFIKEKRVSDDDAAAEKAFDGASDSEAKKRRRLGREPAEISNENQVLSEEDACKEGGPTSHSDEKLQNEMDKPVGANNRKEDGSSSKKEYGIKGNRGRGRVKAGVEKGVLKSSAKDDARHTVPSPRSPRKSTKDEGNQEETPRMSSKRKGTPSSDKASGTIEYGENLVGSKVKVWWPKDRMFYEGIVDSFDSVRKKHKILYQDGDEEILYLKNEKWELVEDGLVSDAGLPVERASADIPSEMNTKKAKTNPEASSNDGKTKISRKSNLKNTATTSGRKSKHDAKADLKSDDDISSSGGKSLDDSLKASGKSKDVDTAKTSGHSKQDTHKTSKSKDKSPRSSHTIGANGKGKTKSSLSKILKESDHVKEKTTNTGKMSESKKGKSQDTSTPPASETKTTGKKRRRGAAT